MPHARAGDHVVAVADAAVTEALELLSVQQLVQTPRRTPGTACSVQRPAPSPPIDERVHRLVQTAHGASPEAHRASSTRTSRRASMGCQKPRWRIGAQLVVRGQALQRFALEGHVVALDAVEHRRLQHEEAAVHPGAVAHGLLLEGPHGRRRDLSVDLVLVDLQRAEAPQRLHGRDRGQLAVGPVEREQLRDVHVGHAVAVGQHERVVAHVLARPA